MSFEFSTVGRILFGSGQIDGLGEIAAGLGRRALLPHVMAANVGALRQRSPGDPARAKYAAVGEALLGRRLATDAETADAGVRRVAELCQEMGIPPLSRYGVRREDVPEVVVQAEGASSMKGNPVALTREELAEVLLAATL